MKRIIQRTILGTIAGFFLGLALFLMMEPAHAVDRSTTERYAFDRMTQCPIPTANPHVCPGYQRMHPVPLSCARSKEEREWLDSRYNMVWVKDGDYLARVPCIYVK